MLLAALALASSLGRPPDAHFVDWSYPGGFVMQKGVALGTPKVDEHLILLFPDGTCSKVVTYDGRFGDRERAWAFIRKVDLCHDR